MSEAGRRRKTRISVRLSDEEHDLLQEKIAQIGVVNQEAYIRKMILDGLVVKLDLPELKQMISLLRYTSNNINQIAKRLNESGRIYDADIAEIKDRQAQLWELANGILTKLSKVGEAKGCRGTQVLDILAPVHKFKYNIYTEVSSMKFVLKILIAPIMLCLQSYSKNIVCTAFCSCHPTCHHGDYHYRN